jgi:putative glutathione S-transferase
MSSRSSNDATDGAFKIKESSFRQFISRQPGAEFPPEEARYHLYISYACPWASKCYAFMKLKGLEGDVIGLTVVKPVFERTKEGDDHYGWVFPETEDEVPGAQPDPLYGARSIRELYDLADPNYNGRYTVPVLWDKKKKTIVNNESSEITKMFNDEFNDFAKHPHVNLYPPHLKSNMEQVNSWTYHSINAGVYQCGFATKQKPYEEVLSNVCKKSNREDLAFICSSVELQPACNCDTCLFATLIRYTIKCLHKSTRGAVCSRSSNIA